MRSSRSSQLCRMSHTTRVHSHSRGVTELKAIVRTRGSLAFLGVGEEGHRFCGSRTPLFIILSS